MVEAVGPGKFYGSSLPRPRIYTNMKFNDERVDPPTPVTDPLISWANEAHWSMGGLNSQRHRLQGRIEGNISKLRAQRESSFKKNAETEKDLNSPSPPPAPMVVKRRRRLVDEEDDEVELPERRIKRKLEAEFDVVSTRKEEVESVNRGRCKGKRLIKGLKKVAAAPVEVAKVELATRASPRLAKRRLT